MLKRLFSLITAVTLAGFMAGCAGTLSQGPNSLAAESYAAIAEARVQATALVKADRITVAKAEEIRTQLRTAQTSVDAYFELRGTDLSSAEGKLFAARAVLAQVRNFLITQGALLK